MLFRQRMDRETSTYTYLLADETTRAAVIIDPVLEQIERDIGLIRDLGLALGYALDTHVHADHVTALGSLRERLGAKTVVSERAGVGCADLLVKEVDTIRFGGHGLEVLETPGHTAGCITYLMTDRTMAFTGDALLIRGCGRTDFQEGDARQLYHSVHDKLFTLPPRSLIPSLSLSRCRETCAAAWRSSPANPRRPSAGRRSSRASAEFPRSRRSGSRHMAGTSG